MKKTLHFIALWVLSYSLSTAQVVEPKYKTTFETMRIALLTDNQLKQEVLQNQANGPLTKEDYKTRRLNLENIATEIYARKNRDFFLGMP